MIDSTIDTNTPSRVDPDINNLREVDIYNQAIEDCISVYNQSKVMYDDDFYHELIDLFINTD